MRLIHGDCLEEMDKLIDKGVKVDLIITSPPYNMGHKNRNNGDVLIKYNTYSDDMPYGDYEEWIIKVLNKCYGLLTDNGIIYFNHKERHVHNRYFNPINLIQRSSLNPLQTIIWKRGGCTFNIGRFVNSYEQIIVAYKTKNYMRINKEFEKYFDIWDIAPSKNTGHPASFPIEIVNRIISSYGKQKKLIVFDPFMGIGTTGISSKILNRDFIGIELDDEYFEIAQKRIDDTIVQGNLFSRDGLQKNVISLQSELFENID